jgi:hypothetical protein
MATKPKMVRTTPLDQVPLWPGIVGDPWPTCDLCTWAWHEGRFELKVVHRGCFHTRVLAA